MPRRYVYAFSVHPVHPNEPVEATEWLQWAHRAECEWVWVSCAGMPDNKQLAEWASIYLPDTRRPIWDPPPTGTLGVYVAGVGPVYYGSAAEIVWLTE